MTENTIGLEQMSIVVIGHVDHGKSTVVGRLLADTGSLPEGRLKQITAQCARNAKPFEYAFLLDALKDEQSQGITIDSARCFFKSSRRHYIVIDAPGHIEFLKNMISGAARAEAAVLVIDAKEGIQENSRRHGYLLSLLGIRQVAVLVNKMDLMGYREEVFQGITAEYRDFLAQVGIQPTWLIPVSAREGDNIVSGSDAMPWYRGPTLLDALDTFDKMPSPVDQPLRLPVQDIYKFTEQGDDRRIVAGRIETGSVRVGDEVVLLPSGKRSRIATIEGFHVPPQTRAQAGQCTGVTLTEQIYIRPGEVLCRATETPALTGTQLKVNLFWMGRRPMIPDKRYKMKLTTASVPVWLRQVVTVLDASDLTTDANRRQIERHDVAECVLETLRPVAFDRTSYIPQTGRFVIIDYYEIAGGGVITDPVTTQTRRVQEKAQDRDRRWEPSRITPAVRAARFNQRSTLVLICGPANTGKREVAKRLEERLFERGRFVYYLGLSHSLLGNEMGDHEADERDETLHRLGEISHLFTDAGMILITTVSGLDDDELETIRTLNHPNDCLVVNVGQALLSQDRVDLQLDHCRDLEGAMAKIEELLSTKEYLIEYYL